MLKIEALAGGVVDSSRVGRTLDGRLKVLADGVASVVNLASVGSMFMEDILILGGLEAKNGGSILCGKLTTLTHQNLTLNEAASFTTRQLEVGALDLGANAVLSGNGTLAANVSNGGEVRPGTSAGALSIQGDFTQTAAGRLRLELGGLQAGTQFDQLNVTGVATLDGSLTVSYLGGFTLAAGQSFRVLIFSSRAGDFATTTGFTQGAVMLDLTYSDTLLGLMAR